MLIIFCIHIDIDKTLAKGLPNVICHADVQILTNVRRPKVVTSAHSSVRPIVTLAVIFENSFVEPRRIILKLCMRKTSKIALFMEEG